MKQFLKVTAYAVGGLLSVVALYLAVIIFAPGFAVPPQRLKTGADSAPAAPAPANRRDVSFSVEGETIRAWLYLPPKNDPAPIVILNHGLGGTKDMLLEAYAKRFAAAGIAALSFDYRHFGESEGEPRQLFYLARQLDDARAAIAFARTLPEIDGRRTAVWGTSAGGGYGLVLAAEDPGIRCVIAQVTGLDPEKDEEQALNQRGLASILVLIMHAQRDMGRSRFGLSPHRIPIAGPPGTVALLNNPEAYEGYASIAGPGFQNEMCPRGLLRTGGYDPLESAKRVRVPVLIQVALRDTLVAPESSARAAHVLGDLATVKKYDAGHFEIYRGAAFEEAIQDQVDFLRRRL